MTETERANKNDDIVSRLITRAIQRGRWELPIGWYGQQKGLLEEIVLQDLHALANGTDVNSLYTRCITGVDVNDHSSWREYVDDLDSAADELR